MQNVELRQKRKISSLKICLLLSIIICLVSSFIMLVYAEPFDFMQLPTYLDNQLGTGTFIAGLLITLTVLSIVLVPVMVLTKGKVWSLYILMGIVGIAPFVALGWFPIWLYIIVVLAITVGLGRQIADALGGLRS